MPTFEEYSNAGRVVYIDRSQAPKCIIVREEDFQYSKPRMLDDMAFSCWFMTKDGIVENSDACITMAEPATGRFCFCEIRGVPIDIKAIIGCRFQLRQRGRVVGESEFVYLGMKGVPRRCILPNDFETSRAYIEFRTKGEESSQAVAAAAPERAKVKSILDVIAGK